MIDKYLENKLLQYQNARNLMLLVEMRGSKKALSGVAGHPAGELSVIAAPTQGKEEDLPTQLGSRFT